MKRYNFSETKAENIYYFVENCYEKVYNNKTLSDNEKTKLGIYYDIVDYPKFLDYYRKEMLTDELSYMYDYIMSEVDFNQ